MMRIPIRRRARRLPPPCPPRHGPPPRNHRSLRRRRRRPARNRRRRPPHDPRAPSHSPPQSRLAGIPKATYAAALLRKRIRSRPCCPLRPTPPRVRRRSSSPTHGRSRSRHRPRPLLPLLPFETSRSESVFNSRRERGEGFFRFVSPADPSSGARLRSANGPLALSESFAGIGTNRRGTWKSPTVLDDVNRQRGHGVAIGSSHQCRREAPDLIAPCVHEGVRLDLDPP